MKKFVSWFNGLPRKTQAISGFIVILALCGLSIGTAILQIVDFMLNDVGMSEEELRENIAEAQSEVEAARAEAAKS